MRDFLSFLIERGVSRKTVEKVRQLRATAPVEQTVLLCTVGGLSEEQTFELLADFHGLRFSSSIPDGLSRVLNHSQLGTAAVAVDDGESVSLFCSIPLTPARVKAVEKGFGKPVRIYLTTPRSLRKKLMEIKLAEVKGVLDRIFSHLRAGESAEVSVFVNALLEYAALLGATDIHMDPEVVGGTRFALVRIRLDGVLREFCTLPMSFYSKGNSNVVNYIISSLCKAGSVKPTEPFDGRAEYTVTVAPGLSFSVDVRVSVVPTYKGEHNSAVVMRLLGMGVELGDLLELGFHREHVRMLKHMVRSLSGMLIITGPTGSGKTTTLYSLLREIIAGDVAVLSIEDPVEYITPLVRQCQCTQHFSFAAAMRSFLRQDPDVILLGEMRDEETAARAVEAALTGHLVLTTLHLVSSHLIVERLNTLGLSSQIIAGALKGICSQRLVRKVCPHCRKKVPLSPEDRDYFRLSWSKWTEEEIEEQWVGTGCEICGNTGFLGRTVIAEVVPVLYLEEDVFFRGSREDLYRELGKLGVPTIYDHAIEKVKAGEISYSEAARVLG